MQDFLISLLKCSAVMTVISLAYVAAIPLLSKFCSAKWRYYTGRAVVLGWLLPFCPQIVKASPLVKLPDIQIIPAQHVMLTGIQPLTVNQNAESGSMVFTIWSIMVFVWIAGVSAVTAYQIISHWRFVKMTDRWNCDITDSHILNIFEVLKTELNINSNVELKICGCLNSPMLTGFFKPTVYLPDVKFNLNELPLIIKHELIHLKRKDIWWKMLIILLGIINWFNPIIYILAKAVNIQCEISCDQLVMQGANLECRKKYGEIVIGFAKDNAKRKTALSTNFYEGRKAMKKRIFEIMDSKRKKSGITIFCIAILCIATGGNAFAADYGSQMPNEVYQENSVKILNQDSQTSKNEQITENPVQNYIKQISLPVSNGRLEVPPAYEVHKKDILPEVDIYAKSGTDVVAPISGTVAFSDYLPGYGKKISISGEQLYVDMSHLNIINFAVGDKVEQGQIIGKVGRTGNATNYMCTLAIKDTKGNPVDLSLLFIDSKN